MALYGLGGGLTWIFIAAAAGGKLEGNSTCSWLISGFFLSWFMKASWSQERPQRHTWLLNAATSSAFFFFPKIVFGNRSLLGLRPSTWASQSVTTGSPSTGNVSPRNVRATSNGTAIRSLAQAVHTCMWCQNCSDIGRDWAPAHSIPSASRYY